ncbi:MAG: DEAD/DEAH box helicase [Candidatus Sumerlaeia bacterium]|nr:DEAD/DEAH box helicase [Candidatus Sumerlaeia bacterium]
MENHTPASILRAANIGDSALIHHLEQAMPDPLFPQQRRFLQEGKLLEGTSALIHAPTGSGKSRVADLAALPHLIRGRQAVHLVPTRSLARERAGALEELFGPMGFRVALSTREERRHDEDIRAGRVDVVVAVYEKAQALLLASPLLRRTTGIVIADEIQLARDPVRGPVVEILLRLWRLQGNNIQLVALTSSMEDAEDFAAEHELTCLRGEERPVPLDMGRIDLSTGVAEFTCGKTGEQGRFSLPTPFRDLEEFREGLGDFAASFEGPVIAFVPTRRQARQLAETLASHRSPSHENFVGEHHLMDDDTLLPWLLQRGVAFHSAELTRNQRRVVEDAVRSGEVDWCFSTTTLAEGVNLSARTVLVFSPDGGFPKPLTNLFGRAGRPGNGGNGRAFECRFRWDFSGRENTWGIPSREDLVSGTLQAIAFVLRASMPPLSRSGIERCLGGLARQLPFKAALEQGLRWGFWTEGEAGLRLLPPGDLAARGGLEPEAICGWRTMLRRFPRGGGEVGNLFLAIGSTWAARQIPLSRDERLSTRWILELRRRLERDGSSLARHFVDYLQEPDHLPKTTHEAAKGTIMALELIHGGDLHETARQFQVPVGVAEEFLQQAGFLLAQLGQLAEIMGAGLETCEIVPVPSDQVAPRVITIQPRGKASPRLILRRGSTGQVRLDGHPVRLTRLQFRLLELLACHPGEGIPYERIERYVWPDASVERQQVSFHKSNIEKRLEEACPGCTPLIETHATWGIRLCLGPDEVRIEEETAMSCLEEDDNADVLDFNSIAGEICL